MLVNGFDVSGSIFILWEAHQALIGLPTSIEYDVVGGRKQRFAYGDCYTSPGVGASFIKGRIKTTYDNARGSRVLGVPVAFEVKSPTYPLTFMQPCEAGRVFWSKADGGKAVPDPLTGRLRGATNFRDAAGEGSGIAVRGGHMRRGLVYRSNTLAGTSGMDRFILQTLGIGTIVAFAASDPTIGGISRVSYPISNLSASSLAEKQRMYRNYVTSSANRSSIGKTLNKIATSEKPVLFHCSQGKDRTGFVSAVIHMLLGASAANIMTEYLKSNTYTGSTGVRKEYLQAGLDQMRTSYGTADGYLAGCGVGTVNRDLLRAKLVG